MRKIVSIVLIMIVAVLSIGVFSACGGLESSGSIESNSYVYTYDADGYTCKLTMKFDSSNPSVAGTYTYEGYDIVNVQGYTMFDTTRIIKKSGNIYDQGEVNGETIYNCTGSLIYAYIPSDKSYANVVRNNARYAKKFTT